MQRRKLTILLATLLILSFSLPSVVMTALADTTVTVSVDSGNTVRTNNLSLGYMLDWDWQQWSASNTQKQLSKDANFKLVRLFSARIEPCTWWYESSKTGIFNWAEVDDLVRKILDSGAEPLICIGRFDTPGGQMVVPPGMSNNWNTNLPSPESYAAYAAEWVKHFKSVGLNVRFYELVNEPYFYYGWDTSETWLIGNYVQLYNAAATRMRSINSGVLISTDASVTKKFLDYFVAHGERIDFIDVHRYGLGEDGGTTDQAFAQAENKYVSEDTICNYNIDHARQIWYNKRGKWLPVIASEANLSHAYQSGTDWRIQQMEGAVYTALSLKEFVTRGYNYYVQFVLASSPTYSCGATGGYGFGLINWDNNKPWYPYYVMKMVGSSLSVGDKVVSSTSSSKDISTLSWIHNSKQYTLLISKVNWQKSVYLSGMNYPLSYSKIDNSISWENPAVQTGKLYAGQTLQLNGYTVMLLETDTYAQTAAASSYQPTLYLADKFESGNFNKWSGYTATSGESIVINTFAPQSGYHVRMTANGGVSRSYIYKDISGASSAYAKMWVYVDDGLPLGTWNALWLVQFLDSSGSVLANYGIKANTGGTKWAAMKGDTNTFSASTVANDKWYLVEAYYTQAASGKTISIYVDGVERASLYLDTSASSVSSIRLGIDYTDTWAYTRVYMSNVAITAS
jgi:hypothetical protein